MLYKQVPKEARENARYRIALCEACWKDPGRAQAIKELCKHDFLFWLNSFCYTHDPRKPNPVIPFITWEFQDECLRSMEASLGLEDVCIVKSRDMGASWMIMALFTHQWQFHKHLAFGAVSRDETLVDGGPKSLFTKVQFLLDRQPGFLLPKSWDHFHLKFTNHELGSTIEGTTTTANVFRGDRYRAVMIDEFAAFETADAAKALASSQGATYCRFFNSTPQGSVNAFYDVAHNDAIKRIDLHWSKHPEKARDKYIGADGKIRSPWYDNECRRQPIPALIAQELDLDFVGSSSPLFEPSLIDRLIREVARPPILRGKLEFGFDPNAAQWVEAPKGPLLLWTRINEPDWKPSPAERYVIGCDISAGTGATNSVASVADCRTREKVAELVTADLSPDKFAAAVVALCHFFNGAYLIWESNGPVGQGFGKRVVELGYRNIYYKRDEKGLQGKLASRLIPGWHSDRDSKFTLLKDYVRGLANGSFINRCMEALKECRDYVYLPTGGVGNSRAKTVTDSSGARENHGDRPTADALANKALGAEPEILLNGPEDPNSFEGPCEEYSRKWRVQKWMREEREKESSWEASGTEWDNSLVGW